MSTPQSSNKEATLAVVREAQANQLAVVNELRIRLLKALQDFDEIGGKEDTESSLWAVLQGFRAGIPYPFLRYVFEDTLLGPARDKLKAKGQVAQPKKRGDLAIVTPIIPETKIEVSASADTATTKDTATDTSEEAETVEESGANEEEPQPESMEPPPEPAAKPAAKPAPKR